ncbi:DUF389 domain-containing protein [Kineosporia sp. NBRC 101731]|uniref:DUF389 domain-containing protein n=1 Tax=Kineosporia sp. NBRC 101731 TaxID=3032199 RepID=UPI0025545521|nr:DUF389 domain-containing protein [Kineosporia sp. NBRC 101731]
MLHLRVVCPASITGDVVAVVRAEPGTTNLVKLTGAALSPAGDLVHVDVAREALDGLITRLLGLGLERSGSIVVLEADTAIGADVERAQREAPGEGDDAVVWAQLAAETSGRWSTSVSFHLFLVIATMIAAVGLLIDSQVLIVGAMVLGPEFTPLAGIAVAVVRRRWRDAVEPVRALGIGFALAIVVTMLGVLLLQVTGQVPEEFLNGRRPLTSFVAAPDVFSVIIALLAGVAGTLSLTGDKAGPLVGVFISVTTVPAAADIAAGLATGQISTAAGAAGQLGINGVCIVVAAVITLRVQRRLWTSVVHRPARDVRHAPGSRE